MGPSIFIVQIIHGRVCEQCYSLVKVFIEYCHELTLSYGNKLFLKNTPVVCVHSFPVYSLVVHVVGVGPATLALGCRWRCFPPLACWRPLAPCRQWRVTLCPSFRL